MKFPTKHLGKLLIYSIWFFGVTLFFIVPLGFHHMFKIGIIPFLFLDGENPQPGDLIWNGYGVHFFPLNLAITILLWAASLFGVYKGLRYMDSKAYLS